LGIGLSLALFIGIPAAVIVGLGYVFTQFRDPILGSAQSVGETFAGIFTRPITGAIGTLSTAFGDLPDFEIKLPGINITQGTVKITEESETESILAGQTVPSGGVNVMIPKDTMVDPETGIVSSSTPPVVVPSGIPQAFGDELTIFQPQQSILVNLPSLPGGSEIRRDRLTRDEIIDIFPEAIGLFDILSTEKTEFIPLSVQEVKGFGGSDGVRLSGQLFEEISNVSQIGGA